MSYQNASYNSTKSEELVLDPDYPYAENNLLSYPQLPFALDEDQKFQYVPF